MRVSFEQHFEPLLLSEAGHKHFLFDLPLDPVEALDHLWFRVPDGVFAQILAEDSHHVVIRLKIFGNGWFRPEVVARESSHAGLGGEEHVVPVKQLLKLGGLRCNHGNIRRDAAAARHLAAAIRQFHFCRMIGNLSLVVVFIKRNRFVVPLNQPSAWRVIPRGCQR